VSAPDQMPDPSAELGGQTGTAVPTPRALSWAVVLVRIESAALLVAAIALLVLIFVHTSTRLWAAFSVAGFALLGASLLWFCSRGLQQLRPSSRTPVVLVQLLALPVTYDLGFQAGRVAIALPILATAVAILILLFTPSARVALDRVR
jgi:hypothetical protein